MKGGSGRGSKRTSEEEGKRKVVKFSNPVDLHSDSGTSKDLRLTFNNGETRDMTLIYTTDTDYTHKKFNSAILSSSLRVDILTVYHTFNNGFTEMSIFEEY